MRRVSRLGKSRGASRSQRRLVSVLMVRSWTYVKRSGSDGKRPSAGNAERDNGVGLVMRRWVMWRPKRRLGKYVSCSNIRSRDPSWSAMTHVLMERVLYKRGVASR